MLHVIRSINCNNYHNTYDSNIIFRCKLEYNIKPIIILFKKKQRTNSPNNREIVSLTTRNSSIYQLKGHVEKSAKVK